MGEDVDDSHEREEIISWRGLRTKYDVELQVLLLICAQKYLSPEVAPDHARLIATS